jgi:hypothetical protein
MSAPHPLAPHPLDTAAPATPPKNTDWTAVLTSKTFLGTVLATLVPLATAWINGTPPTVVQIITALGIILGAAGLRDWMGRIESYAGAVSSGLNSANIPPK